MGLWKCKVQEKVKKNHNSVQSLVLTLCTDIILLQEVRVMLAHLELVPLGPQGTLVQLAVQELVEVMESRGRVERMEHKDLQGLLAPREIKVRRHE